MMYRYLLSSRIVSVLVLSAATAAAQPVSDNLGIVDDPSYARFQSAMAMSSYAMTDYALAENPRVAATVTAGLVFLSVNPLASEAQVTDYIARFSADLAAYDPSDPNLLRRTSFFAAVRSLDRGPSGFVRAGLDTRVSARVFETLRVGIRTPLDFRSARQRTADFENARVRSFTNAPELPLILTHGLMGNDIDGNQSQFMSAVIQAYLISEGFEIIPDGIDDERFELVTPALMSMPTDFTAYMAFQSSIDPTDVASSTTHTALMGAFDGMYANSIDLQDELAVKSANGISILEAAANAENPTIVEQVLAEYENDLRQDSGYWADVQWRTLLLLQSQDAEVRSYSTSARSFAHIRLESNKAYSNQKKVLEVTAGGLTALAELGTGNWVAAASWAATSSIELAGALGAFGAEPPSAEEQIFEQLVEVRVDIENLRVEMNERFNRLESTLNQVYFSLNNGFAQIGDAIGDLSEDVEDLSRAIAVSRAVLDRIEDALYALGSDLLNADLGTLTDLVLNYRNQFPGDLSFSGPLPSYATGSSALRSFNVDTSVNQTFAGPLTSNLTSFDVASQVLSGSSIGRNINDLRTFPVHLPNPQPMLSSNRIAALGPWAQSATIYAQFARENPWYFAYAYEGQSTSPGQADLDAIIERGEDLHAMMAAGRSGPLFDALINGYSQEIAALEVRETQLIDEANAFVPGYSFDIFSNGFYVADNLVLHIPPPSPLTNVYGSLPFDYTTNQVSPPYWWWLFAVDEIGIAEDISPLLFGLVTSISFDAGQQASFTYEIGYEQLPGVFADRRLLIWVRFSGDGSGVSVDPDFTFAREFIVDLPPDYISNVLAGGGLSTQANREAAARDVWSAMQSDPYAGINLAGFSYQWGGANQYTFNVLVDRVSTGIDSPYVSNAREKLEELLVYKQQQLWESLKNDSVVALEAGHLNEWLTLLDAYATLSMPDLYIENDVARAALRGLSSGPVSMSDPTIVDYRDSNALRVDIEEFYEQNQLDPENAIFVGERLTPNIQAFDESLDDWLTLPFPGHPYLNYTLEDLNVLRDSAFELAVDDLYEASSALTVSAEEGLLANDVDQEYRTIVVESYTQPDMGSVAVNPDGSFTYTAPAGFEGVTSFTYTSSAEITEVDGMPQFFESDPAVVVITVALDPVVCLADVNGDGVLSPTDFTAWINAFNNTLPGCDQNGDGSCTPTDFTAWIANYNAGCI